MPVININKLPVSKGEDAAGYPAPFDAECGLYEAVELGDAAGLTQFGVGLETLLPGGKSSQRHWHENEDEFLYVLSGELVLVEDDGEHILTAGAAVGWKAGDPNGHHLINRTNATASFLIMGGRAENDTVHYPDIDLHYSRLNGVRKFAHKDGTPYEREET